LLCYRLLNAAFLIFFSKEERLFCRCQFFFKAPKGITPAQSVQIGFHQDFNCVVSVQIKPIFISFCPLKGGR